MKLLLRIYSIYVILVFISLFFIFLIPLLFFSQRIDWHKHALEINHAWARLFFRLSCIRVQYEWHFKPDREQRYILCANHFSYLDIPAMGLIPVPFKFIGKSSLGRIPLFGYMYNKIHITVNRASLKSRADGLKRSRDAVEQGFNVTFFPEGGVVSTQPPQMVLFKDGAFRLAVEKNIPIVPVTFPYNFHILPDDERYLFSPKICKIIVHKPIFPTENSEKEVIRIKNETYKVIQQELIRHHC